MVGLEEDSKLLVDLCTRNYVFGLRKHKLLLKHMLGLEECILLRIESMDSVCVVGTINSPAEA